MQKRYQVFISSTFQDLSAERLEVIKALLELDCIPCGMEYFPAASEDSWTYIANLIEQCDYYVVIVAGRYGSMTKEGISFTQKEYEYAVSKGIPTIAFIHANPQELPVKNTDKDADSVKKLSSFIDLLQKNLCKQWTNLYELGAVVSRSLTQLIKHNPRIGWIPANQAGNPAAAEELLILTKRVRELEEELKKAKGRSPIKIEGLSDGNDVIHLQATFTVYRDGESGKWPREVPVSNHTTKIPVTWNELFRAISPRITPTANDTAIKNGINDLLYDKFKTPRNLLKDGQWCGKVAVTTDSFNVIRIQFIALRLVTVAKERGEEKSKSVLLWRLTDQGEERMFTNLAVRRIAKRK